MSTRGYENFTAADAARIGRKAVPSPAKARSKYGAVKVTIDGVTFDSKAEGRRYTELKLMEKAGHIARLVLQPRYPLKAPKNWGRDGMLCESEGFWTVGEYVADFEYDELTPAATIRRVEDVKGMKTPTYRWKKKHFEIQYGIQIREIR